jgi:starch phosphorylase
MQVTKALGDGTYEFEGMIPFQISGKYGYTVRVLPHNELLATPFLPGYILWAS